MTVLVLLEIAARVFIPQPRILVHDEHEELITVGGLPALNKTMEPDPDLFWRLKESLDDVHIAGSNAQHVIDFRVTTHQHRRSDPVGDRKQHARVLVLGDSCAFGVGVEDNQTWPRQMESTLLAEEHDVEVINAGVPGYTAYQGLTYLEQNVASLQPDLVICCFGFNDQDTWASRSDLETAKVLEASGWQSGLLRSSRLLIGLNQLWHDPVRPADELGVFRPRLLPEEYIQTLSNIRIICEHWRARMIVLIWPFRVQVEQGNTLPGLYQAVSQRFGARFLVTVVDLVPAFIAAEDELYVDHIHANVAGCQLAAYTVAEAIVPMLDRSP